MRMNFVLGALCVSAAVGAADANPLFEGWYADPQIRRFGDRYWIFPTYSHDFREQTFMDVFSSKDLRTWTKHPQVLTTNEVKWAKGAMWAPDAQEKDGKYYLFFAANDAYPVGGKRADGEPQTEPGIGKYGGIGVAVADRPEGPYRDLIGKPLIDRFWNAAQPIDQYVFRHKDDWYMVYGGWGKCNLVRLAPDFKSLVPFEDGRLWRDITPPGYTEGSVMFERKGVWYFMYSGGGWVNDTYCVKYCTAPSPFGPFEFRGVVLSSQRPIATGAGHHSVLNIPGTDDWYICYHRRPIPNESQHHRVTCLDRMYFNDDGSIKPVVMTGEMPLVKSVRALTPVPQCPEPNSWWMKRHAEKLGVVTNGGSRVVFIGDSITHGWEGAGKVQWNRYFSCEPYRALNLGYGADRTEHVLWRITDGGELDGYEAKCVVLMIGTNNSGHFKFKDEPPSDTILGIREILRVIRRKQPKAKIVLMPILPRENDDRGEFCALRNGIVNAEVSKLANGKDVFWCDFSEQLLTVDGRLPRGIFPDALHPNGYGYEVWAVAVKPYIDFALSDGALPSPGNRYASYIRPGCFRMDESVATYPVSRVGENGVDFDHDHYLNRLQERRNQIAASGGRFDLVFVGDSITHFFENVSRGLPVFREMQKSYSILNLGYAGDRTENVLWRLANGELEGYAAKGIMLMIGTNNTWHRMDKSDEIAAGIRKILDLFAEKQPQATVFLLPIFPIGDCASEKRRVNNEKVNAIIRGFADGKRIVWVDFNRRLVDERGDTLLMMPDRVHPNERGYRIWFEEMQPRFREICGK